MITAASFIFGMKTGFHTAFRLAAADVYWRPQKPYSSEKLAHWHNSSVEYRIKGVNIYFEQL